MDYSPGRETLALACCVLSSFLLQDLFSVKTPAHSSDGSLAGAARISSLWKVLELELISRLAPDRNIEAVTAREDWNGKGKKMQRRIDRRLVSCSPLIAPAGSSLDR